MVADGKPVVSAILINKDGRDQLLATLGSLSEAAEVPVETIVVDNASLDGSADAVAARYPSVKLVRRSRDGGFGRAGNAGLSVAEGRFVLLLDPSVTLQPGCLGKLTDLLLTRPDAGAASPQIQHPDGRLDGSARRGFPTPGSTVYTVIGLSQLFPRSARFNGHNMGHLRRRETHEIDAGSAACLMVRRAAIDRVGFFDPDYDRHGEDLDLCYRLKAGGWKVFYLPEAVAVRSQEMMSRADLRRDLWDDHRSLWTFHHKHYAADLPAFGNGLVWAANWTRFAYRTLRLQLQDELPS
ncbi:MAG: glycosyltransferase family 2 protein [Candidatus Dormibacteraeota bacterium]|nr:glycosyltransferase family 2 protein [Candidatus Dormibacteraeota bacterium]